MLIVLHTLTVQSSLPNGVGQHDKAIKGKDNIAIYRRLVDVEIKTRTWNKEGLLWVEGNTPDLVEVRT